ncbi:Tektin-3 [Frankliniella fusca]|uniref:Tektin-3 n=1 Tax=Frankliniella fusca TaxID=407009 RepID=A0AAE1HVR6_9NEOP|nr:Tektin-3 [Frankliniella fusca]
MPRGGPAPAPPADSARASRPRDPPPPPALLTGRSALLVLQVEGRAEPYFPQPEDDKHPASEAPMEPVGPWAQGKPDWGPLSGMTGTRPAVDRYSITRYSVPEWRKHNLDTFQRAAGDNHNAGMVEFNSRACMQHVASEADKNQADSTGRLEQRAMDVHRWLAEVRKAHKKALHQDPRVRVAVLGSSWGGLGDYFLKDRMA